VAPSLAAPTPFLAKLLYKFTSFRSFVGSPDGLFTSRAVTASRDTPELLETLHWSIVASASMLPCAVATKTGSGGSHAARCRTRSAA